MTGQQNRIMLAVIAVLAIFAGLISFSENPKLNKAIPVLKRVKTYLGLDIRGGVRVTLAPKISEWVKKGKPWTSGNLDAVRQVIDNRVNQQGVSEPLIITKPESNQVVVELPGLKDEKEALERLQSTASLQFYLLRQLGTKTQPGTWTLSRDKDGNEFLVSAADGHKISDAELEEQVFSTPPIASGDDLVPGSCKAEPSPVNGSPIIHFEFDPLKEGSKNFEDTTRSFPDHYLAVFLDKKLLTAPTINGVISGSGIIEGNFTLEGAKALGDQLNAGALPVPLEIVEVRKLEATLGKEAVAATTLAGGIGLILVLVFMIAYYRLPGILASVALILYAFFSFALFKLIPVTLTLPGIAGFILSIGMAVDANILIFERLKEELRSGKTLRAAIDAGFKRAFTAILDSNVCTLIICFVLGNFLNLALLPTIPAIRGFAMTLAVGVGVSMFTAITVTRTFLFALVGFNWAQNPAAYGLDFQFTPTLNVMKRKMLWLGISGAIIIPGVIAWFMGGIKPSIDFKGGTEIQIPYQTRHSADQIQRELTQLSPKYRDSRVVVSGGAGPEGNVALITTPKLTDAERLQIVNTLTADGKELAPGHTLQTIPYSNVSGTISDQLTTGAVIDVIIASCLIVLYLAFRFSIGGFAEGLKYGTCAVVALLHDVLVLWGAFALLGLLFNWQIDSLFVTAMLTVIGFSVHDTIIVFDRVRENLQHRQRGEDFSQLTDRSIDQTIARSINTSFTVVLTLAALFFFGGSIIHQFAAALLIGIVSGTYSSIFNASVLLVMWKQRDSGLALAGVGSAVGLKTGLGQRSGQVLPGDRPLVTPKSNASPFPASTKSSERASASETPENAESETFETEEDLAARPRSTTPRRPTQRRQRRM